MIFLESIVQLSKTYLLASLATENPYSALQSTTCKLSSGLKIVLGIYFNFTLLIFNGIVKLPFAFQALQIAFAFRLFCSVSQG